VAVSQRLSLTRSAASAAYWRLWHSGPIDDQKVNRIADSWPFWLLRRTVRAVFQGYASVFGSPMLREVIGPTYLEDFFESYVVEALRSGAHVDTLSRLIWGMPSPLAIF